MRYDVAAVRRHFPALRSGTAHFDGPGGSQVPASVGRAVADTLTASIANRGTTTAAARRAEATVAGARWAVADLLDVPRPGVVFGRSATQLTFDFSRALAKGWEPGHEVVVTRLDHDANVRPWTTAAQRVGAVVRWADFEPRTGELEPESIARVLSPSTRLVAVTAASNLIGTRPDLPGIVELVHQAGAQVYVDGVHLTPHASVSVTELGADFYCCSAYKFFGPHSSVVAAQPETLEALWPDKLAPSTDAVPERFELGTLPYELLAGVEAAVDFMADLAPGGAGSRRQRLVRSMRAVEDHEGELCRQLEAGLGAIEGLSFHGHAAARTPTVLFSLAGVDAQALVDHLASLDVNATAGSFYALEASRHLGLGDTGAVRAGLAPYTDSSEVARLVDGVASARSR